MSHLVADSITCRVASRSVLSDIYLSIQDSEIVGLVGCNGCGKTTLLQHLLGVGEKLSGVVKVDGQYVAARDRWRHMSYLPQGSFLPRDQEVRRAARLLIGAAGDELLRSDPRLRQLTGRRVGTLSSGERRYLEFRLVLGLGREFTLLDEPFTQIEPLYVQLMVEAIKSHGRTSAVVLTDHDYRSVQQVCTRLLSLNGGVLRAVGREDVDLTRAGYLPGGMTEGAGGD